MKVMTWACSFQFLTQEKSNQFLRGRRQEGISRGVPPHTKRKHPFKSERNNFRHQASMFVAETAAEATQNTRSKESLAAVCCKAQPAALRSTNSRWEKKGSDSDFVVTSSWSGSHGREEWRGVSSDILEAHTLALNNNPEEDAPWVAKWVKRTEEGNITCSFDKSELLPSCDFLHQTQSYFFWTDEDNLGKSIDFNNGIQINNWGSLSALIKRKKQNKHCGYFVYM